MIDQKVCEWLVENGDVTTRYRVYNELFCLENEADKLMGELLENEKVVYWLNALKPEIPPQHRMHHGSFDYNFENAMLKCSQLGLHASFEKVRDAVGYYFEYINNNLPYQCTRPSAFLINLSANLLMNAEFQDAVILEFLLTRLDDIYRFVSQKNHDIYICDEERKKLKAVPKNWKNSKFIKPDITSVHGFCYPLIYDIVGMHKLYQLKNPEVDRKIDEIIGYISNDEFNSKIQNGYGILIFGDKKYYGMGWDPKYPGWFDVRAYMQTIYAPRVLFFAEYFSNYPIAINTKWFGELLAYLEEFKTESGTYIFPAKWLKEQTGYAVGGNHISFGENRKKKNWAEIESTLYMQLLQKNLS